MRHLRLIPQSALPPTNVFGRDLDLTHYRRYLGQNRDEIFYDAANGLRANAFLALAATLNDHQALCLHLPDTPTDPDHARLLDYGISPHAATPRFNQRLRRLIHQPHAPQSALSAPMPPLASSRSQILLGKRGRGKTHYLAQKLRYLHAHGQSALVVLPFQQNHDLFRAAQALKALCLAPDDALLKLPAADYLLLDEAASIAPQQVLSLTHHYPRYALATTTDGYEGYGQKFQRQVLPTLIARDNPEIHECHHGYRFPAHDPLESALEAIFLYATTPAPLAPEALCPPFTLRYLNPNQLASDEALLRRVYALLNLAHYQTNPEDVKRLLDLPHQHLWLAQSALGELLGVLYAVEESALPRELAAEVMAGKRRPQGRMLLQQILHRRQNLADNHAWLRISRLAVHPEARRKGVGLQLVQMAQKQSALPLGVCYQAGNGSDGFWQAFGFKEILPKSSYNCLTKIITLDASL